MLKGISLDLAIKYFCFLFLFLLVRLMENNKNIMRELYELYLELGHEVFEEKIKKPMELHYLHNTHDSSNVICMSSLLLLMRRIFLMWGVTNFLCLWIMIRKFYVILILLSLFMIPMKIIMIREHMLIDISIISSSLSLC